MTLGTMHMSMEKGWTTYPVRCHCGAVGGRFKYRQGKVIVWECNCSDCNMRKNLPVIIPESDLILEMDKPLDEATILYQWGTKTAVRRFCKTCGVLPWYRPRSNPDGVGITAHCVDWTDGGTKEAPEIEVKHFDGIKWEDTMRTSAVGECSARAQ